MTAEKPEPMKTPEVPPGMERALWRGRRKINGAWVVGFYDFDGIIKLHYLVHPYGVTRIIDPDTLGQCTGEHERDPENSELGRLIFGGDKVRRIDMNFPFPHDGFEGVVVWREGMWVIDNGTDAIPLWTEIGHNVIIGNIHES